MTFSLVPTTPFRLDLTAWGLRRRPDNAIDRWDGRTYRRTLVLGGRPVGMAVAQTGRPDAPRLRVTVTGATLPRDARLRVTRDIERLLGIRVDLSELSRLTATQARIGPLVHRFRGLKPPRFPSTFEALANAIACQQVTLNLGILLLNRLAETAGLPFREGGAIAFAFPRPADVASLSPQALRRLGFSHQKAQAMITAARAVTEGELDLEGLAALDDETALARLRELRGVGRWTAEYVLLRGLGRLHIFPGDDVGARNHLQRWLGLKSALDYERVRRTLARWHPYAGLVYFHLLLKRLAETGHVS